MIFLENKIWHKWKVNGKVSMWVENVLENYPKWSEIFIIISRKLDFWEICDC